MAQLVFGSICKCDSHCPSHTVSDKPFSVWARQVAVENEWLDDNKEEEDAAIVACSNFIIITYSSLVQIYWKESSYPYLP